MRRRKRLMEAPWAGPAVRGGLGPGPRGMSAPSTYMGKVWFQALRMEQGREYSGLLSSQSSHSAGGSRELDEHWGNRKLGQRTAMVREGRGVSHRWEKFLRRGRLEGVWVERQPVCCERSVKPRGRGGPYNSVIETGLGCLLQTCWPSSPPPYLTPPCSQHPRTENMPSSFTRDVRLVSTRPGQGLDTPKLLTTPSFLLLSVTSHIQPISRTTPSPPCGSWRECNGQNSCELCKVPSPRTCERPR